MVMEMTTIYCVVVLGAKVSIGLRLLPKKGPTIQLKDQHTVKGEQMIEYLFILMGVLVLLGALLVLDNG